MSIRERAAEVLRQWRKRRDEFVDMLQEQSGEPRELAEAATNLLLILVCASVLGVLLLVVSVAVHGFGPWLAMLLLPAGMLIVLYLARLRPPDDDE